MLILGDVVRNLFERVLEVSRLVCGLNAREAWLQSWCTEQFFGLMARSSGRRDAMNYVSSVNGITNRDEAAVSQRLAFYHRLLMCWPPG